MSAEISGSHQEHARRSPSSSAMWLNCTAALAFIDANADRIPPEDDRYSKPGTVAHDAAAEKLMGYFYSDAGPLVPFPEGHEHFELNDYVQRCIDIAAKLGVSKPYIEARSPLFYGGGGGTSDFAVVTAERIVIRDLKWGAGVHVDAEGNEQLMIYAASFIDDLEDDGLMEFGSDTIIQLDIDQPRHREGGSSWEISYGELRVFMEKVRATIAHVDGGAEEFKPSEKACRWCKAKTFCPARLKNLTDHSGPGVDVQAAFDFLLDLGKPFHKAIGDDELARIYKVAAGIRTFLKDLDGYALDRALADAPLPDTKLVRGKMGNRAWADTSAADQWASNHLNVEERYKRTLLSPTQIEKLMKAKSPSKIVMANFARLVTRKEGALTVAPTSDKRPNESAPLNMLKD